MKIFLAGFLTLISLNTFSLTEFEQSLNDRSQAAELEYRNAKIGAQSLPESERTAVINAAQATLAATNSQIETERLAGPPAPASATAASSSESPQVNNPPAPGLANQPVANSTFRATKKELRAQRREARKTFRAARKAARALPPEERDAALALAKAAYEKALAAISAAKKLAQGQLLADLTKSEQEAIAAANNVNGVLEQNAQANQSIANAQIASTEVIEQIPVAAADDPSRPKQDVPGSRPVTDPGRRGGGGGGGARGSQVSAQ